MGGWTRFRDRREFDDLAIVAISDSWYPGLHTNSAANDFHCPTVDHTVHFLTSVPLAQLTEEDFLLVEFSTAVASEGYLVEEGHIWSPNGTLIARSHQLAIILPR